MPVRKYRPADRKMVLTLLQHKQAIDASHARIFVSADGTGVARWVHPASGDIAYLGPILTVVPDRRLFYDLILACCDDAIAAGFAVAEFHLRDRRLMLMVKRDFNVTIEVFGRNGATQKPTSWRVEVDLLDAQAQLWSKLAVMP